MAFSPSHRDAGLFSSGFVQKGIGQDRLGIVSVSEYRPADPGSIQGSHRLVLRRGMRLENARPIDHGQLAKSSIDLSEELTVFTTTVVSLLYEVCFLTWYEVCK